MIIPYYHLIPSPCSNYADSPKMSSKMLACWNDDPAKVYASHLIMDLKSLFFSRLLICWSSFISCKVNPSALKKIFLTLVFMLPHFSFFFFPDVVCIFLIEVLLIYSVVLISAVQQWFSYTYIYILFYILFHYGLLHRYWI